MGPTMTEASVERQLTTKTFGRSLRIFESLGSTNDEAKRLASAGAPEGAVVVAIGQSAGRGRQDRTWHAEPGKNLTFSIILRPPIDPASLGIVSLFASVAVANTVSALSGKRAGCKWPNDVLVGGKKISGILCESVISGKAANPVIVGIGLNVNQDDFPDDIAPRTTSLLLESGAALDLPAALATLLGDLEAFYQPDAADWPGTVVAEWTRRSVILGSGVEVRVGSETIAGIARSVKPTGALCVESGGRIVEVTAGDVHLS